MKKSVLHVLCASLLLAGIPAQAIPSRQKVGYPRAVERFKVAKQRFEAALKSHKKVLITTAALALIAAVTAFVFSRSGGSSQIATGAGSEVAVGAMGEEQAQRPEYESFKEATLDLMKKPNTEIWHFLNNALDEAINENEKFLTTQMVQQLYDSPLAKAGTNRAQIAQFLLKTLDEKDFADNAAYSKAQELFGSPQSSTTNVDAPARYAAYGSK